MEEQVAIEIAGPELERSEEILTGQALELIELLHREFDGRRLELLEPAPRAGRRDRRRGNARFPPRDCRCS